MTLKVGSQSSPTGVQTDNLTEVKTDVAQHDSQQIGNQSDAKSFVQNQSKQTGPNAKRSEMDLTTQARYAAITKQLPQTPITGPDVRKQITDPRKMAESHIYTPQEKVDFYQRYLEREGPKGLQKLLSESENWPDDTRRTLDEALAKTPGASRYATQLSSTDDQIKYLNRMFALGDKESTASGNFVDVASPATLNKIALKMHGLSDETDASRMGSRMNFMMKMAQRSGEMSPAAQQAFAKSAADFNIFDKKDIHGNESFRKQVFQTMFGKMTTDAKNAVFDELQNTDKALDFAKSVGGENSVPQEVLNGLSAPNADFLRQMYSKLMNDAKLTGDTKMFSLYERNMKHLEGWMENHFPNYARK